MAPTGGAIDISLSLRMTIRRRLHRAGVVHGLVGHAGRHRAVADDTDDVVLLPGEVAGYRHAQTGRNRGRGMRRPKTVVFALRSLGETGEAAAGSQGADTVAAAGEDLVRISLMADVPDQLVGRGVENVVQRNSQFDDAEARAKMSTGDRHRADGFSAQFVGDLLQVLRVELSKIGGFRYAIKQRSDWLGREVPTGSRHASLSLQQQTWRLMRLAEPPGSILIAAQANLAYAWQERSQSSSICRLHKSSRLNILILPSGRVAEQ